MNDYRVSDSFQRGSNGVLVVLALASLLLFWPLVSVVGQEGHDSPANSAAFDFHCEQRLCQFWLTDPALMLRTDLNLEWDFGDGRASSLLAPLHLYDLDGSYQPKLVVYDNADARLLASTRDLVLNFDPLTPVTEFGAEFRAAGGILGGTSVAGLGDFNASGLADLLVGAPDYFGQNVGRAYIAFGRDFTSGDIVDLTALDGSDGFTFIAGDTGLSSIGRSGSRLGAIAPDISRAAAIGAPGNTGDGGQTFGGQGFVAVLRGAVGPFPPQISALDLLIGDGSQGFLIEGLNEHAFGFSVASAGDFIGNGLQDIVIGAPQAPIDSGGPEFDGYVYIIFGRSEGFPAEFGVNDLTTGQAIRLQGEFFSGQRAGWSVDGIGDFNGNGADDIVIGAPFYQEIQLFSDPVTPNPDDSTFEGTGPEGTVATSTGAAYVVFGGQNLNDLGLNVLNDDLLNGVNGFTIQTASDDMIGWSVAGVGDLNSNGSVDLAVSAPSAPHPETFVSGAVYVLFGGQGAGAFGADFDPSTGLNGTNGFAITGLFQGEDGEFQGDRTISISSAGDVNGDGFDDLVIGLPGVPVDGVFDSGVAYVIFGRDGAFPAVIDVTDLDPEAGFRIIPTVGGSRLGQSVAGLGDFSGSGVDDLVLGAPGNSDSFGLAWVIAGQPAATPPLINDGAGIPDQNVFAGQTAEVSFTVSDLLDDPADILVSATSVTPNLIPPDGVSVTGAGETRTLTAQTILGEGGVGQVNVEAINSSGLSTIEEVIILIDDTPAPVINGGAGIADQEMITGESLEIDFQVEDPEFAPDAIEIVATSGNEDVLPSEQLSILGEGTSRTLLIETLFGNIGSTPITIEARNPLDGTDEVTFSLTILAPPPVVNDGEPIDDAEVQAGDTLMIDFRVSDPLDPAELLEITVESSNTELVPLDAITIIGTGDERTLVIETRPGTQGESLITLTVTNTNGQVTVTEFLVQVFLLPTTLGLTMDAFTLLSFPDLLVRLSAANLGEETAFSVLLGAEIPEPFEVIGVFVEAQSCVVTDGAMSCDMESLPAWECSLFEGTLICGLESLLEAHEAGVVLRIQGSGQAELSALLDALNAPEVTMEIELDF